MHKLHTIEGATERQCQSCSRRQHTTKEDNIQDAVHHTMHQENALVQCSSICHRRARKNLIRICMHICVYVCIDLLWHEQLAPIDQFARATEAGQMKPLLANV